MIRLATFLLASYIRSYRYFAPVGSMLIAMMLLYSYKPNPVMDSYAVTSAFLFVGGAWLSFSFLNHAGAVLEQLSVIHAGSMRKYAASQMLALLAVIVFLSAFFLLYPVVMNMFAETVSARQWLIASSGHLALGMLGAGISYFLQAAYIRNISRATAILLIIVILSIGARQIAAKLPAGLSWIRWAFPPVAEMIDTLMGSDTALLTGVWGVIGYAYLYAFALAAAYWIFSAYRDART
ncbi:hypothetical protein [Paenibacillus sp. Y412MC10]|uniref:hypothetical protein n=1 Tax=Geobacillus sp. (strain Y412MC10) TaxID=481743 RepID=UPI0011A9005B|nr:hypothetical protein [Paenibacillus sp. Y412MC10]